MWIKKGDNYTINLPDEQYKQLLQRFDIENFSKSGCFYTSRTPCPLCEEAHHICRFCKLPIHCTTIINDVIKDTGIYGKHGLGLLVLDHNFIMYQEVIKDISKIFLVKMMEFFNSFQEVKD